MTEGRTTDELVQEALTKTAQRLARRYPDGSSLKERQFEDCFEEALQVDPGVRVLPHKGLKLVHWRKAFAIDTTAVLADGARLVAELKWGSGKLYNCSWDLMKLGVALNENAARYAYLVAGAPENDWACAQGAELFAAGEWEPRDLRQRFRKHFDFWAVDVPTTGPIDLPARVTTTPVSVVEVPSWRGEWSLRGSRLKISDATWVSWESLI